MQWTLWWTQCPVKKCPPGQYYGSEYCPCSWTLFSYLRTNFSYVAYPLCVRYALVTRPFYSVSTSTDFQRITICQRTTFIFIR